MAKKTFITGALILMLAGFITRIIGFIYRIYLSNLIGAEGMGLYQLVVPVYTLIVLTLTAGVSIAVSKMVAEEVAKCNFINIRRITRIGLLVSLAAGFAISLVLYLNLNLLVNMVIKDKRTYLSMLYLVPCIPFIAAASAVKGYFYGIQEVTPTAISQIVEQIIKIGIIMGFATYFLKFGLEYACALATIGMALGEMSNLLVLTAFYRHKRYKHLQVTSKKGMVRKRVLIKRVLACAVPVSVNRFIISIMMAVEVILIPQRLLAGGLNAIECMQEYGKLTGMAMPLILFPALVTTSISTTLVPAISESLSINDFSRVNYRISKSIQITMVLGFLFTALYACYSNQIAELIYPNQAVGHTLFLLSFTCVLLYLTQIMMGIMNGLGKQGVLLLNSVIGAAIRILCVIFLIPKFGIPSYVAGILVSSIIVCILNFVTINKNTGIMMDLRKWVILPGIVTAFMIFTGKYIYSFFNFLGLATPIHTLFVIIIFMLAGLGLMTIAGVIDRNEVMQLVGLKRTKGRRRI